MHSFNLITPFNRLLRRLVLKWIVKFTTNRLTYFPNQGWHCFLEPNSIENDGVHFRLFIVRKCFQFVPSEFEKIEITTIALRVFITNRLPVIIVLYECLTSTLFRNITFTNRNSYLLPGVVDVVYRLVSTVA